MLVKAIKSFAGKFSMWAGEVKEIADDNIAKDLLNAGYIEEVEAKEEPKAEVKKTSRKK